MPENATADPDPGRRGDRSPTAPCQPYRDAEPAQVQAWLGEIRRKRGDRRCSKIDPLAHVNATGQTVVDCMTCGRSLEPTLKSASHYRHVEMLT